MNQNPKKIKQEAMDPTISSEKKLRSAFERMLAHVSSSKTAYVSSSDALVEIGCTCQGKGPLFLKTDSFGLNGEYVVCGVCDPVSFCQLCHGTGFQTKVTTSVTPQVLVQEERVSPHGCICQTFRKVAHSLNEANIPERFKILTSLSDVPDSLSLSEKTIYELVIDQVLQYQASHFQSNLSASGRKANPKPFLIFTGPVGTGKTFLATRLLQEFLLHMGQSGLFVEFQALLYRLRNVYTSKGSEKEILQPIMDRQIVVIDELGKGRADKDWIQEKLDEIISARYNDKKITIFTTNYPVFKNHYQLKPTEQFLETEEHHGNLIEDSISFISSGSSAKQLSDSNQKKVTDIFEPQKFSKESLDQPLIERVGQRIFDRLIESSMVISLQGLPSLRQIEALKHFQQLYR